MRRAVISLLPFATLIVAAPQGGNAAPIVYTSRPVFEATLGTSITDDYENPDYPFNRWALARLG
jgi:hypothetical protein